MKPVPRCECREAREYAHAALKDDNRIDREDKPDGSVEFTNLPMFGDLGNTEVIDASGRATCRQCMKKIAKGEKAIRGEYDFSGCGTWTLTTVQIHFGECEPDETEMFQEDYPKQPGTPYPV